MTAPSPPSLLAPDEPSPLILERPDGRGDILLVCEHAGRLIPAALGDLGLPDSERSRHIGWDIGAFGVALHLSVMLDAHLIGQAYSRLVIDCNRRATCASLVPRRSEATDIPGNAAADGAERDRRRAAIWQPYQNAVAAAIASRQALGRRTILVAVHSFTPVYLGVSRRWHLGFLHGREPLLAQRLAASFADERDIVSALNEPYVTDECDYTIPVHGDANGLATVLLEIRNDLIADAAGQRVWAEKLASALAQAVRDLPDPPPPVAIGQRRNPNR